MLHAIVLGLFIVIALHDAAATSPRDNPFPIFDLSSPVALAFSLGPMLALVVMAQIALAFLGRALDRTGKPRTVNLAHLVLTIARPAILLLFAAAVLLFGWIGLIRDVMGDLVALDEIVAMLPPIAALAALAWSYEPIERRLREASIMRALDTGQPLLAIPTRPQFVLDHLRHHVLLILIPLWALLIWWESIERIAVILADREGWAADDPLFEWAFGGVHLAGVLIVLAFVPLILRRVWSTVPLAPGPLRDRLMLLCRDQRVRVRNLLLWRTHNAMINGALVGVVPAFRYILLTDALLDRLPDDQVEAVMAHEIAHARRHHLPWLIATMLASISLLWPASAFVWSRLFDIGDDQIIASVGIGTAALTGTLLVFGFASRLFERQADAFAAQHLSGRTPADKRAPGPPITDEAALSMAGALAAVARLNHIDPAKFSFRHGSINTRRRRLRAIVGRSSGALPVDKIVRRYKIVVSIALLALVVLTIVEGQPPL